MHVGLSAGRRGDKPQQHYCIISRKTHRTHRNAPCTAAFREGAMPESVFRRESAAEYFKELVEGALAHQRLNAGELTAFYVVNLLTGFLQRPAGDDTPLGVRLAQALESGGMHQRTTLREIGDLSLFVSGFFSDSLRRKLVDVDY